jgi:nicotinate phosphoribosyltransferase
VSSFRFSEHDISIVRKILPTCDEGYFDWLREVDCSKIKLYAQKEGSVCFPKVPLIRVEGPVGVAQLLETTLLCLVNYASLVATNAARHRLAAGKDKTILEFGLRRAQGPDGGISASRYTFMGGCDGTSNVLAGGLFNIPVKGTHAHSFVASFTHDEVLTEPHIKHNVTGKQVDLVALVKQTRKELGFENTNTSELTAFTAYALSFPAGFLGLVDTYDTLKSGLLNFLCVALALHKCGYKALGIRLDSGGKLHQTTPDNRHQHTTARIATTAKQQVAVTVAITLQCH